MSEKEKFRNRYESDLTGGGTAPLVNREILPLIC